MTFIPNILDQRTLVTWLFLFFVKCLTAQSELELLEQYLANDPNSVNAIELYDRIMGAEHFTGQEALEEMLHQFPELYEVREAKRIFERITATNDPQKLGMLFLEVGNIHHHRGRNDQALEFYQQAIPQLQQSQLGNNLLPGVQMQVGSIYEAKGNYVPAQEAYQSALRAMSINFSTNDLFAFPPVDGFIAPVQAIPILAAKARVFISQFKSKGEPQQLMGALQAYEQSIDLVRHVRPRYPSEKDQLRLTKQLRPVHENAINTASQLDQLSPGKSYLERAFQIAEKAKGNIILQNLITRQYQEEGGIDPVLLQKERSVKSRLAFHQSRPNPIEDSIDYLQAQLFDVQETIEPFLTARVPDLPLAKISEVQELLPSPLSVFVDFFLGYDHLFVFTITQSSYHLHQIPHPTDLLKQVSLLKEEISTNHFEYEPEQAFRQYTQTAYKIYQELFEKAVLAQLDFTPKQLILSPDDQLWSIPFEVLLKKEPKEKAPNYHPEALDYLFKNCSISYVNSATLYVYNNGHVQESYNNQTLAAFAPAFTKSEGDNSREGCFLQGLANLNYNQLEAQQVAATFSGTTFLGHTATKQQFVEAAQHYQILHLATHACINDGSPLDNRIFFADGDLPVYEIYQMDFKSQLVVLSACETGVGAIHQGEGVMSLARGFVQANCPNVVMSLWEVADKATAHLMGNFYQELDAGHSQSEALRLAKLDFLYNQDRTFTHPYYWAGFVHLGQDHTLVSSTNWSIWWWGLPLLSLFWIGILFKRRK